MKKRKVRALIRRAISVAFPDDQSAVMEHVEKLSELSIDQLEELMRTEDGMLKLRGPFPDVAAGPEQLCEFSEFEEAIPGRMTDDELARVLSGGTRREWGPYIRLRRKN